MSTVDTVVQPELENDNFDQDDFGSLGEQMEDEEDILEGADEDDSPDLRNI